MEALTYDYGGVDHAIVSRPLDAAPSRNAPYEQRAAWSERYVAWYLLQAPMVGGSVSDIDATHRYEVEFNSCVLDPQEYERDTQVEIEAPSILH
ncbi:MAG: hypothetical protein AB7H66_04240 [Hyphomonadaceae bacterium]